MSDLCLFCDNKAVAYCDAIIGVQAEGVRRNKHKGVDELTAGSNQNGDFTSWTCDAPICSTHRKLIGFMCGEEGDTMDHCPYHINNDEPLKKIIMFWRDAEKKRREIHAEIRKARLVVVP